MTSCRSSGYHHFYRFSFNKIGAGSTLSRVDQSPLSRQRKLNDSMPHGVHSAGKVAVSGQSQYPIKWSVPKSAKVPKSASTRKGGQCQCP